MNAVDKTKKVLLPFLQQAGIRDMTAEDSEPGRVFVGKYESMVDFASLVAQNERVAIIDLLYHHGVEISQAVIEAISDRKEEWV